VTEIRRTKFQRSKLCDAIARVAITLGGILIIASVIAIVVLIVWVTLPLFGGARADLQVAVPLPEPVPRDEILTVGVDFVELGQQAADNSVTGYTVTRDGTFTFLEFVWPGDAARGERHRPEAVRPRVIGRQKVPAPPGREDRTLQRVERPGGSEHTLLWSDGSVSLVDAVLTAQADELGRRTSQYALEVRGSVAPDGGDRPVRAVMRVDEDGAATCAMLTDDQRLVVLRESVVEESLFGGSKKQVRRSVVRRGGGGTITAITISREGGTLYAGTDDGHLLRWELDKNGAATHRERTAAFPDERAVTTLAMVFGDVSLAVGDGEGEVTVWAPIRTEKARKLTRICSLSRHDGEVKEILASGRNKSLLSLGEAGKVFLDYVTSHKHLLTLAENRPVQMMGYSPRGNAVVGLDAEQNVLLWYVDSPHPEISVGTLFGKVWYDGHDEPKYMWQSSGTHEPKFSLVPVIFGTLKATVYAMFFAVPLALFSAMYVSHFTSPAFKRAIKPVVEVMAAIPTVVIGFLILLWAAPLVGKWIMAVFAGLLIIPVTFVLFLAVWQLVRKYDWAKRVENGYEFLALVPVVVLGAVLATLVAIPLENALMGGDFRQWLFDTTQTRYEQLNSLVVAFGLGFAVIPIIFSISEDSLSSIPYELTAASLAVGASRWQTVWRVILPSASPGIFAAVMIGFGRAVGETMIVFMATGNTPIMDVSPFNGFRTLSANIAVEISEAPRDGTLYRVLFLCAVLLFLMTFLLNTAAEVVRTQLRKKYGRY